MAKVNLSVELKGKYHTIKVDLPRVPVQGEEFDLDLPESLTDPILFWLAKYRVIDITYGVSVKEQNKDIGYLKKTTVHLMKDI